MKFKSENMTQASGSIAGVTYAHNRGGMYRRARSIPTNPNSAAQQTVRANFAMLSSEWGQILSQTQRDQWSSYAANNPTTNVFGDPLYLTGQQMFIRCNTVQMQAGLGPVLAGPATNGMVMLTPPALSVLASTGVATVVLGGSDPWASEDDAAMNLFASRPQSASVNFFKAPFRLLGTVLGDSTTAPTGAVFADPFSSSMSIGQKVFYKTVVTQAEGRISAHVATSAIAT